MEEHPILCCADLNLLGLRRGRRKQLFQRLVGKLRTLDQRSGRVDGRHGKRVTRMAGRHHRVVSYERAARQHGLGNRTNPLVGNHDVRLQRLTAPCQLDAEGIHLSVTHVHGELLPVE